MAFYYYEVEDPQNPGQTMRAYFPDNTVDEDDIIYQMPGGIHHYDALKEFFGHYNAAAQEVFLDNQTIVDNKGNKMIPRLEESQYSDPELARIERASKPIQVDFELADTSKIAKQPHIKVEGIYEPKSATFTKMIDYDQLPKMERLDEAALQKYQQADDALPHLTQIKRGMHVKILGRDLKIRPADNQDEGFYLLSETGEQYDMTDFLQVNSNAVLLWAVPKDLPVGRYRLRIISGWYAEPSIVRTGGSKVFELI